MICPHCPWTVDHYHHRPPNPGSQKAWLAGCVCPVYFQRDLPWVEDYWWINNDCPVHRTPRVAVAVAPT